MKTRFSRKPRNCPNCDNSPVASILSGMPAYDEKMQKDIADGRLTLGGCCIGPDDPKWKCSNCDLEMYRKHIGVMD